MAERNSSGILGHTARYAVGNVARHLVGFAMLPIYTRFLTPADYGVIALLTFALALFEPLFGARLSMALPKFYFEVSGEQTKRAVIWAALGLTGLASAGSVIALILFRDVGAQLLFGDQRYALVLGLFSINLLSRPLEDTGMMYLRMHKRSRLFLTISIIKLALQVALNVFLVVIMRDGVLGAVWSGVISSVVIGSGLTVYVTIHEAPAFDWHIARRMLRFSWPLWLSGLGGLYVGSSGSMYLRIFGTLDDVGRLELALKFATVVSALISSPFLQHWTPLSYQIYREENGRKKFQVAFIGLAAALFVGGLGISIFGRSVIEFMAAKPFYTAANAVPLLTLGVLLNELRSFFNFSFLATDNTKFSSLCQYVMAAAITFAYLLLIPHYGLMGAAEAQCIAMLVGFAFARVLARRYYDPGISLRPMAHFALISVSAYLCSAAIGRNDALVIDLLTKSVIFLAASTIIAVICIRAVGAADETILENLPWPLQKLARLASARQLGGF